MKSIFVSILVLACATTQLMADTSSSCLGGVCVGDSIESLKEHSWLSGDQLESVNIQGLPYSEVVEAFELSKNNMKKFFDSSDENMERIVQKDSKFISEYVLNISENERKLIAPYYTSKFFDDSALESLQKTLSCRGKKLVGFKQTKSGNMDAVTIMPSPSTGKFTVVAIQRQFVKMDKLQKEEMLGAIKSKYPDVLSTRESRRATFSGKWDKSKPMLFWDDSFGILNLTMIINDGYAMHAYGKEYDKELAKNQSCSKATTPSFE